MSEPIRVVLVEDNKVFREALELLLGLREIQVVGSVPDGSDAAAVVAELRPDVVLMDYRLPGLDGAGATREVIAASGAAVVCLTAEANAEEREEILRAGARGLVEKGDPVEALAAAIRSAAE